MLSTADLKLLVEAKEAGSMFQRFFIPGQSNAVLRRRLQSWREPPTRRGRVRGSQEPLPRRAWETTVAVVQTTGPKVQLEWHRSLT